MKIGEKVGEWEMKGEGHPTFPLPPHLPICSCNLTLKRDFGGPREHKKEEDTCKLLNGHRSMICIVT